MDRCRIMCMPLMFFFFFFMVGMSVISLVDAQAAPDCASSVLPCMDYLNSTNPPDICCNPIKEISATQKTCFCDVMAPGLLESFGINTTQALRLIDSCGVDFNVSICKGTILLRVWIIYWPLYSAIGSKTV